MNFVNQINMLFYLLLFNQNIFMTMQNDIVFDLDKEYTNLMLLSNFDSVKQPGIDEEQLNLERRMQFRLIAWNFAEKYGLENEKKKIARNKKGEIKDMIKYACELWDKTTMEKIKEESKTILQNSERYNQATKALRKQIEEEPMSVNEMIKIGEGDCDRLEFHLLDKSDPFEEMPKWVVNFFNDANQMHYRYRVMKRLLSGKKLEEDNFEFWWTKFQKRIQELRDEEQLKKALELEDAEAKMGRSMAIIPFNGSKKEVIPFEDENEKEESQFLREMRKLIINSVTRDGQEELKLVKRQIIKMTSANILIDLEEFFPTLLGIGTIEEKLVLGLYKNIIQDTSDVLLAFWEFRMSSAFLYGRIWRKLFDQLFENQENEENTRADLKQLFEISKKFKIFAKNIDKYDAEKLCLVLLKLWRKIIGENEDHEIMDKKENFEQNRMAIRKELLWMEYWAWLDLLKKMDKQLLDSNFSPGNIYKFSEFFGGFDQIWSKIIEMEKSGQKPIQLDNMNYSSENFMDKMLAPFRTKLTDFRLIYNIEDYFEKIVLLHSKGDLKIRKMMWKTTIDIKRCIWGLDLLIWMRILDEQIDQISNENNNEQLVNAWWNARVEMEIFHDSLAIRAGGFEGIEKPALYMLNWMYLLKHQKCIIRNDARVKTQIEEFDEEENRKEMDKNLISYIEKCKKLAKEFTEKERKHFDEDEIRKWRWFYLKELISEGQRFYSSNIAFNLDEQIEDQETLTKLKELIGSEFLAELTTKGSKSIATGYLVEKWIEIFQIPDKKSRFQASLEVMYLHDKRIMDTTKYHAQKFHANRIAFQREYARKTYDGVTRIEQQVANVLGMEEKELLVGDNFPTTSGTKNIEITTDELSRQINMIRCVKMVSDFCAMLAEEQGSAMYGTFNFNTEIQMATSEFVQANFHQIVEELRNNHMKSMNFKRFARVLQSDSKLVEFLRNEVGAVHTLNTLLGLGYNRPNGEKITMNYDTLWDELNKGPKAKVGDEEEKEKRRNIEIVWEVSSKGANTLGNRLENPLRDINFFNDKRLLENYALAFKKYKLKGENSPIIMHSLAANILVFMQHFEQFVMAPTGLLPKLQLIRSKYGEQIRLFARIEYDKVLTDFGEVKFHIQREFFARMLAEINSRSKKEIISEILHNYRLEKIAVENEKDKIFEDFDQNLRKFHFDAFVRLLRKEKLEEQENKGKKEAKEFSFAKILSDANSEHGRREILFNFMGDFERIASVFNEIGPRGMKIHAKDYAHFVKGKVPEEKENQNEQILPSEIQTEEENLAAAEMPLEIIELTTKEIGKSDTNENSKKMEAEIVESPNDAPISFMGRLRFLYNYIPSLNKFKEEKNENMNKQTGKNGPKKRITKFFIFSGQNKPENRKYVTKVEIFPMKKNNEGKLEENKPENWTTESKCDGEILNQNKVKGKFIVDWGKCGLSNEFWNSSEMAVLQMLISIREPNSTSENRQYIVNFSMDLKINAEVNDKEQQREKLRKLLEGRHLIEIDVTKREKSISAKKSWADMTDSDHSDSDKGEERERKNLAIQEIVQDRNEQQQIEEIRNNKKSAKEKKKEKIQMAEEISSSNSQTKKKKKKKKDRFQITEKEASSNAPSTNQNDIPAVDVAGYGGNSETSSKSKNKNEKKKRKKIQQKVEKRGEKEERGGVMVDLPLNEIVEGKIHDHKLPPFEKYFNDQFIYKKFLEIYEKFIAEQKWSPEEHLFLTIGTYLNEIGHKLKALDEMKEDKLLLTNSINLKLVEEIRKELTELKLNEEREWSLEEFNILMIKLHGIFTKLLAQIDGYDTVGGKEKDDENLYDQIYLRLQLNWICFARAICEEKKLEKMWSVESFTRQTYNRDFVALIGQQPKIVVEKGQKKNEYKLNALEKLRIQFEKEYLIPYKQMLEQNAIDRQLLNEYWPNNSVAAITFEFNKLYQQFRWSSEQIRQARSSTQQIRNVVYNVIVNDDEDEAERPTNLRRHQHINFAIQRIEHLITKIWAPQSTLKIGGSYQLGTLTPNSDIDAILIASKRVGRERFFGKTKATCESNRWCMDIDSLYCQLCQNKNVFHLMKYPNNHIPHMKFTYCTHFERHQMDYDRSKLPAYQCTPFELILVSLPGYGIISEKTLQNTSLLIDQFREKGEEDIYEINWDDSRAGMIHALSGYQLNEFILSKLTNKNMLRVFRICLVALKKWAENNHIYGGQYGFLNSASLGLMLLKIVLRFPITPMVPFILEQFFVQFVNWPWPMPIQFAPLGADKTAAGDKKLGWQAEREKGQKQKMLQSKVRHVEGWHLLPTLNMPIISPCKPERNVAYSVNHSTQQIIQRQLKLGLEMIEKIREQQQQNSNALIEHDPNKYSWKSLLSDKRSFGEKYTHYIVFYCFAKTSSESPEQNDLGVQFCDEYVLYQLRLQLIFSVERNPNTGISRCHILPNMDMGKQQKKKLNDLSRKMMAVPSEFRKNSLNRYWIIGLEFADEGALHGRDDNYAEKLENWLNKSQFGFVEKFIQDYFIFSMRKYSKAEIYKKLANVHLYAKFVPADQLGQWSLPNEIWFEILTFVKFHESPNLFLVNRDLLPICQEFFHSGNVGTNKSRNVRDLKMQLKEGIFTIFVKRGGKFELAPVPKVEPPKIFKSFGCIRVGNCCHIQAMQFMIKFQISTKQVLFSKNSNMIIWKSNLLQPNTAINNAGNGISQLFRWQNCKQQNPIVDCRQFFFDWLEKEKILLELQNNNSSNGICRVLTEPIVAKFNGYFMINLKNEGNLCEEDSKLIYKWISSGSGHLEGNRLLGIDHFDVNKALELACQIATLFGKEHCDKVKAEKMELFILMPKGTQIPNRLQPICNIRGDHLATLRTISITYKGEHEKSAYLFYTKPLEHLFENKEARELIERNIVYFE